MLKQKKPILIRITQNPNVILPSQKQKDEYGDQEKKETY